MAVKLSALRTGPALLPRNIFILQVFISVRGWVNSRAWKHWNLKKEKNQLRHWVIEPATFRLAVSCRIPWLIWATSLSPSNTISNLYKGYRLYHLALFNWSTLKSTRPHVPVQIFHSAILFYFFFSLIGSFSNLLSWHITQRPITQWFWKLLEVIGSGLNSAI
jgi:hypothetical protein